LRHLEKWVILAENHWVIVGRKLTTRRGEIEPFESELRGYDRRFHLQRLVLGRG